MDFKNDIKIDKYHLDFEWERQADLYIKWAERTTKAINKRDIIKSRLDVIRAEIDESVRRNPRRYDLRPKPTNPEVEAAILRHPKYKKQQRLLHQANKEVRVFEAIKDALHHKRYALENLVRLHLAGYFGEPRMPKEQEQKMYSQRDQEEISKLNRPEVKRRIKKRRK